MLTNIVYLSSTGSLFVAKLTAQSMLFLAVSVLLTLMLLIRHINHLSALCWNIAPQYGTLHTSQALHGHD